MASGPLDDLVALHIELGVFQALDQLPVLRQHLCEKMRGLTGMKEPDEDGDG